MKTPFQFELGAQVRISVSHEAGIVVARAQYIASSNAYLVRYRAGDGRAVEAWWSEDALVAQPQ
jgi:hypothetical protein